MLLCSIFGIICALIFISVLIIDRQCRTVTIALVLNSVLAGLVVNIVYTCQAMYQFFSDQSDELCEFRGFLLHGACGLLYHTFCVQAIYRVFATLFSRRQCLRSKRVFIVIVIFQWLISFTFGLPILLDGRIKYQAGSRICQVSLSDVYGFLYLAICIYVFPILMIIGIYIRIVTYIKQNLFATVIRSTIFEQQRQQRELRILRRVIMPVIFLFIMGIPYIIFFLITQFSHLPVPPYAQRICFMFISFGQGSTMLLCLINADGVRKYLIKAMRKTKRHRRRERLQRINIIQLPVQIVPARII